MNVSIERFALIGLDNNEMFAGRLTTEEETFVERDDDEKKKRFDRSISVRCLSRENR